MFDQISETLSSDLNNPYPSLKPVINQTLNWLHYSSDAAKAAFLSLSLPSARLIVWLVMSGRVAETSLRDYGGRERERERWHHRPLSSRLPVAIVTGCGISCWRSIRGLVQIPAMCVFLKVPDPSATWITWMITIIHTHTLGHKRRAMAAPQTRWRSRAEQKPPLRAAAPSTQSWINPNHNWLGTSEPSLQQRDVRAAAARFHITTWLTIMWATNPPERSHRGPPAQVDKTPRHTMWLI